MLIRKVNYLEYDDELIRHSAREDLQDMDLDEVKLALEERGVYVQSIHRWYRSLYDTLPTEVDKTGLVEKSPQEIYKLLIFWLKLNSNKHPHRSFAHEPYLKEMIRFSRLHL